MTALSRRALATPGPGFSAAAARDDYEAVKMALTPPWSTGPVEGHIDRLKLIKRSGYGRMKLDLLRQRVLYHRG